MNSLKIFFVFAVFVAIIHADDEDEKDRAIFEECAKANGLKMDSFKKGEKPMGPPPTEVLCAMKCAMEKRGMLVGGKIQTEEARKDPKLLHHINTDKIDAYFDCLKPLEITECADIEKMKACEVGMR